MRDENTKEKKQKGRQRNTRYFLSLFFSFLVSAECASAILSTSFAAQQITLKKNNTNKKRVKKRIEIGELLLL